MKLTPMMRFLLRGGALVLAAILAVPTVYASAGEQKIQTAVPITDGLTYKNTITVNNESRVESFALEMGVESAVRPILLQASGTVYGLATINRAVTHAREQGYHVLGAINTDYFSTTTGVPMGIVIEDGVYKSSSDKRNAMVVIGDEVSFLEDPVVELSLTNEENGEEVRPDHFNKWRNTGGGLYLLNRDFSTVSTRTSTSGWYVRMKVVEGEETPKLTVNSTLTMEVTECLRTEEAAVIGEGEYILTADDAANRTDVFRLFDEGDRVTLTTTCEDEILAQAQWAGGVGDIMVADGKPTDPSGWTHVKEGRAPRTALGVKKDGTLILYAADGRQSGYSMGLSQKDLANELLEQSCEWAVNLDGGGSTAMSVWLPGQSGPAIQNMPSDGKARSCATYLLLVTEDKGDGQPDRLAMVESGLTLLAGSSAPLPQTVVVDSGLNLLEQELTDLTVTSRRELGDVTDGVYTAGTQVGTDTLRLRSKSLDLVGEAQVHIVDTLTDLVLTKADSTDSLTALTVKPGEQVQLAVLGRYWGREALRDSSAVSWTVSNNLGAVDENGLFTATEAGGTGTLTAYAGGITLIIPITMTNVHDDVTEEHWAYKAVEYCYANGIVGGISTTQFGRDDQIRRGDFMLMLYNAVGKPAVLQGCDFTDVKPTDYYYTALSWAQGAGLASGTGNGAYSPNAPITREQAFTILRQTMPLLGKYCPDAGLIVLEQFPDRDKIADYAKGHTATLVAQGVVSGKGDGIDPRGNLTRAEMAALLYKLITYTPILDVPTDPVEPEIPPVPEVPADPVEPEVPGDSVEPELPAEPEVPETPESPDTPEQPEIPEVPEPPAEPEQPVEPEQPEEPAATIGVVTGAEKGLNVRSGPGTTYEVIGGVDNEVQVTILTEENGWYHISYRNREGNEAAGYVSADYIRIVEG